MTAQDKATIKTYFQTGDVPTQAQFIDFIDSYVDTLNPVLVSANISNASVLAAVITNSNVNNSVVSASTINATILNSPTINNATVSAGTFNSPIINTATVSAPTITAGNITAINTGLKILDTNASHTLAIVPGSDLTANRTFTLTTGDANRTLQLDGDVRLNPGPGYTPTLTNGTNVAASALINAFYCRLGNLVIYSMALTIDPTSTGAFGLEISLPIASNFTDGTQAPGTATCREVIQVGQVYSNPTTDRLVLEGVAASTVNLNWTINGIYVIM